MRDSVVTDEMEGSDGRESIPSHVGAPARRQRIVSCPRDTVIHNTMPQGH